MCDFLLQFFVDQNQLLEQSQSCWLLSGLVSDVCLVAQLFLIHVIYNYHFSAVFGNWVTISSLKQTVKKAM